jgi:hypothetical protein
LRKSKTIVCDPLSPNLVLSRYNLSALQGQSKVSSSILDTVVISGRNIILLIYMYDADSFLARKPGDWNKGYPTFGPG